MDIVAAKERDKLEKDVDMVVVGVDESGVSVCCHVDAAKPWLAHEPSLWEVP